ncbi:MAG: NAD(P)H-hydrate epimerase [Planctomycetes bacterium]|nr:NAD(P)H-hydrate epimerase [Planctomycetota bacterium]
MSLTREQVRAFDKHAIEQLGIPAAVLMENAGAGAARILQSLGIRGPVVICCGKGNNGGDGLVIARHLANAGGEVLTLLFAQPADLSTDAAVQWNIVQRMRLSTQIWADEHPDEAKLAAIFAKTEWIVDALFGTGLTGPVRSPFDRVIASINAAGARILAVDIPSGLDCDTGLPLGEAIRAEHTVTFVAPKIGFANPAALAFTGRVHVVDIGITPQAVRSL